MTAAARQPNCLGLPSAVADKYFMAHPQVERFQYLTALAMCQRCVIHVDCLADAIRMPFTAAGVRGGESASGVIELRRRFQRGDVTADALALDAVARQRTRRGASADPGLRAGRFPDMPLVELPAQPRRGAAR